MVYTVTMNPSLDYLVDVEGFSVGGVNRAGSEAIRAGGKGINVSLVLRNLGVESVALGFSAGFTGEEIERRLSLAGVSSDFVRLGSGSSRINVKVRSRLGGRLSSETEVNGVGPHVGADRLAELSAKIARLSAGDTLVLAGSVPSGLGATAYADIIRLVAGRGVRVAVDASGALLREAAAERPFLVKPNAEELGALFGTEIRSAEAAIPCAVRLREEGAENVLVSLAGDGAVLAAADGRVYRGAAPSGTLVNSVGAGDSMLAGFIAGLRGPGGYAAALKEGICAGSASAFSSALATGERVRELMDSYPGEIAVV